MPAVFVHGVPDTSELWDPVLDELDRNDTVALRLPGFGEPVPDGFRCTKEEYAAWIVDQLRAIGEPVDLVGHDWGALLVQYVGAGNPDLIRTWAGADGPVDTEYVWHDMAQAWQTPGVGEEVVAAMTAETMSVGLGDIGHPDPDRAAARVDDVMRDAILRLYRSAVNIGAEWQPTVESNRRPALVLWGTDDPYAPAGPLAHQLGARVNAPVVLLDGGHWAIFEHPDETARALEELWASVV